MRELSEMEVKALADTIGIKVHPEDLFLLTIRLNGMIEHIRPLEALPLEEVETVLTTISRKGGNDGAF